MAIRHDPKVYREVCTSLDALFKKHGDKASTCINRYLKIRREKEQKETRIEELEDELASLKKVDSLSRKPIRKAARG
jgi:hypothetical protein